MRAGGLIEARALDAWWLDLLELGYRDGEGDPATGFLDCSGVVEELYRRRGVPLPEGAIRYGPTGEAPTCWTPVQGGLAGLRLLDVLASDPNQTGAVTHVSAVVAGEGFRAHVLTSGNVAGVFGHPAIRARGLVGAYRFQGDSAA